MNLSDPVADMLTRIRNAQKAGHDIVEMPHSQLKVEIARILRTEGYITDYTSEGGAKKQLRLYLKYTAERKPVIRGLRRASRPGARQYVSSDAIPRVLGGIGLAILTTSKGVLTGVEAQKLNVGGELLCSVW